MQDVRNDEGYTLLELLVALAIMAMISVPLAQSMSFGLRVWGQLHSDVSENEKVLLARRQISEWLSGSYAADPLRLQTGVSYPFSGTAGTVIFLAPISPDPRSDSILRVKLELTAEGEMVASIAPDHMQTEEEDARSTQLLSGVKSIEFSFLRDQSPGGVWISAWQDQVSPPNAVRLKLEFNDSSQIWPELIVPLGVDEWAHCSFDVVTKSCFSGADAG